MVRVSAGASVHSSLHRSASSGRPPAAFPPAPGPVPATRSAEGVSGPRAPCLSPQDPGDPHRGALGGSPTSATLPAPGPPSRYGDRDTTRASNPPCRHHCTQRPIVCSYTRIFPPPGPSCPAAASSRTHCPRWRADSCRAGHLADEPVTNNPTCRTCSAWRRPFLIGLGHLLLQHGADHPHRRLAARRAGSPGQLVLIASTAGKAILRNDAKYDSRWHHCMMADSSREPAAPVPTKQGTRHYQALPSMTNPHRRWLTPQIPPMYSVGLADGRSHSSVHRTMSPSPALSSIPIQSPCRTSSQICRYLFDPPR